eukprot:2332235-Rhodomonas_salina.1
MNANDTRAHGRELGLMARARRSRVATGAVAREHAQASPHRHRRPRPTFLWRLGGLSFPSLTVPYRT